MPSPEDSAGISNSADASSKSWLRDLASAVAILSVIAGVIVSVLTLKQKAQADERTANVQLESARIQLQIAREQGQQKHADGELDFRKHSMDLLQQERTATIESTDRRAERLNATVSHIFSSPSGAEGDLAVLFNYLNHDSADTQIVEKTVLARLENPHSREEVTLGFAILDQIKPQPIATIAEINRSARRHFDHLLWQRYLSSFSQPVTDASTGQQSFMSVPEYVAVVNAVEGMSLSRTYAGAVLSRASTGETESTDVERAPGLAAKLFPDEQIAEFTIRQSSRRLVRWLVTYPSGQNLSEDLRDTYIELPVRVMQKPVKGDFSGAYFTRCPSPTLGAQDAWTTEPSVGRKNGFEDLLSIKFKPCR